MDRLGALAQFELDHFDLICRCLLRKAIGVELTFSITAAEIAARDFPDDIATFHSVIGTDAAFTRIMAEAAELRASVECSDCVR